MEAVGVLDGGRVHQDAERQPVRVHREVAHRSATRLDPCSRLAASQPRGPPLSVVLALGVSMIAAVGPASRPAPSRSMTTQGWRMLSHAPAARTARMHPCTVRQGGKAGGGGRRRHWQPVRTTWNSPSGRFRMSVVRGRPPGLAGGISGSRSRNWSSVSARPAPTPPDQRAIRKRPHGGLQSGNRPQRRRSSRDQLVKPAQSPFANGQSATARRKRFCRLVAAPRLRQRAAGRPGRCRGGASDATAVGDAVSPALPPRCGRGRSTIGGRGGADVRGNVAADLAALPGPAFPRLGVIRNHERGPLCDLWRSSRYGAALRRNDDSRLAQPIRS